MIPRTGQKRLASRRMYRHFFAALVASTAAWAFSQTANIRCEAPTAKVGDRWKFETRDGHTGLKESETLRTVVTVSPSQVEGIEDGGKFVATPELNFLETPTIVLSAEAKYFVFPLEVGKKWKFKYDLANKVSGFKVHWELEAAVVAYEKVKVQAGEFDTFKIEYKGYWNNRTTRRNGRAVLTSWYAPEARTVVKTTYDDTFNRNTRELVEVQLQP